MQIKDSTTERRLNPLISIIASTSIFILGLLLVKSEGFLMYLAIISLIFIACGYGKFLFKLLIILLPLSIFVTALALLSSDLPRALENGYRTFLFGFVATLTLTIEPASLVRSLNKYNVPKSLTLSLLISLRFIGILKYEIKRIKLAMITRGITINIFNLKDVYRAFIIPFISRILTISDNLSDSLEIRAFDIEEKGSTYKTVGINKVDILFTITIGATLMVFTYHMLFNGGSL